MPRIFKEIPSPTGDLCMVTDSPRARLALRLAYESLVPQGTTAQEVRAKQQLRQIYEQLLSSLNCTSLIHQSEPPTLKDVCSTLSEIGISGPLTSEAIRLLAEARNNQFPRLRQEDCGTINEKDIELLQNLLSRL